MTIHQIMCRFGFNKWKLFRMANSFIAAFPEMMSISRRCTRCGRLECTEDGETWTRRP